MSEFTDTYNHSVKAALSADRNLSNGLGSRLLHLESRIRVIESFLAANNKNFKPAPPRQKQIDPLSKALASTKPAPIMKIRPVEPTVSDLDRKNLTRRDI